MKHKNKELIRDIIFMTWSFVGAGIMFNILLLYDINYLTGSTIKDVGYILTNNFYTISALIFILFMGVCYILKRLKI